MNKKEKNKFIKELNDKILKGLDLTFKRLIEKKIKENGQLVFSENGKIVYVDAKDINVE